MTKDEFVKKLLDKVDVVPHEEYLKGLPKEGSVLVSAVADMSEGFPDDMMWHCDADGCQKIIRFRPYNYPAHKRICTDCFIKMLMERKRDEDAMGKV